MCERIKLFSKFLNNGKTFPCNIFTQLIFELPQQVLLSVKNVDKSICLKSRQLCNCYASSELDCDCLKMPLLNHFVYIISSFGAQFDLAKQIIDQFIEHGCDVNEIDADIGTVLHSVICCIDNDIKMNATRDEYNLSLECLEYLLSLNKCDYNLDVGCDLSLRARGTALSFAVERQLLDVVIRLISGGVCVSRVAIRESVIPQFLDDITVQICDLLYIAGYKFSSDAILSQNNGIDRDNCVKFSDWMHEKNTSPMSLKYLSRIILRHRLNNRINDQNLKNYLQLPKSLILFIQFLDNKLPLSSQFQMLSLFDK